MTPEDRHAASAAELMERRGAERSGIAFLVYRDAAGSQRIMPLDPARPRLTLGRSRESDLSLAWDAEVSRVHAELEIVGGEWALVDDGLSQNGTFVNGSRLRGRRRLHDGDELRLGRTVVIFRVPPRGDTASTEVPDQMRQVSLTETQRKVLVALCRPYGRGEKFATPATNQQIAAELFLSVDAIKGHLRALFTKFAIDDLPPNRKRARLAELALESGIVGDWDLA